MKALYLSPIHLDLLSQVTSDGTVPDNTSDNRLTNVDLPVCDRMWICKALSLPNTLWHILHLCLKNGSSLTNCDLSMAGEVGLGDLVEEAPETQQYPLDLGQIITKNKNYSNKLRIHDNIHRWKNGHKAF